MMRRIGNTTLEGGSSPIATYNKTNAVISGGVLTIDASLAANYYIVLDQNVTSVVFNNWIGTGDTQRIALYLQQDATGNRTVSGWPANTLFPEAEVPFLSISPNAVDCIVIDSFDGGITFYVTLVGTNYS